MRLKKRQRSSRFPGSQTHGRGFKKKARGSGHRGGFGMAGTGKRGDQKKTMILNLFGNDYFGKSKTLRRGRKAKKLHEISLSQIEQNLPSFMTRGIAKELGSVFHIELKKYKILSSPDFSLKAKIFAGAASQSAIELVKKSGGEIVIVKEKHVRADKAEKKN